MEAYSILAKYYDVLMKDFDYDGYIKFISPYVKNEAIDLCCGSGVMSIALSKMGAKTIAVDNSQEMLNIAKQKAKIEREDITFICNDIKKFTPIHKVDTVTCVCDGINYIPQKDISKLFQSIANYIKEGGYFIFDISSEYKLTKILASNIFCEDTDSATYIWSNKLHNNRLHMNLAFFENAGNGLYKRIDEEHDQYVHCNEDLLRELYKYFKVNVYDGTNYKQFENNSNRALFVCERI